MDSLIFHFAEGNTEHILIPNGALSRGTQESCGPEPPSSMDINFRKLLAILVSRNAVPESILETERVSCYEVSS